MTCRRNESLNRQPFLSDAEAAAACCANLVPVDSALGGYPAFVRSHSCILFRRVGYERDIHTHESTRCRGTMSALVSYDSSDDDEELQDAAPSTAGNVSTGLVPPAVKSPAEAKDATDALRGKPVCYFISLY